MQDSKIEELLLSITALDVRAAASTAALVICFSGGDKEVSAKLTFAALYKFSKEYSNLQELTSFSDVNPFDDNPVSKDLSKLIYESGSYYFGPMFDCRPDLSIHRSTALDSLSEKGFLLESISQLEDTTLDMFYTRALELGL